jgi:hypothetical protein
MGTISGCGGPAVTRLLQNLGNMNFTDVSPLLPGFKLGGVTWGDYNNDGYTDLLFTGLDVFEMPKTGLYLNNLGDTSLFAINTPPSSPQGLEVTMEPDRAILHWNRSSDLQTPINALSYNICIGTLPDAHDVISPLALLNTGSRTITAPGNASADTSWIISGIPPGAYYFSVQAIDNGFMPGTFSNPHMFSYAPVGIEPHKTAAFSVSPNPCHERLVIHDETQAPPDSRIRIIGETGKCFFEGVNPAAIDLSSWPAGLYLLQKTDYSKSIPVKFIKK